jgi:dsDNA-specific endonuclease/ATPase MutS2
MAFAPGDAIHVRALGKGIVREVRNGGRYLVEVNGRSIVTTGDQLTAMESTGKTRARKTAPAKRASHVYEPSSGAEMSLDLHGLTVDEAIEAVGAFLNDALLTGVAEARIIHGRSGGKLKASVHAQLKRISSIRSYAVDPRNAGVTVVKF